MPKVTNIKPRRVIGLKADYSISAYGNDIYACTDEPVIYLFGEEFWTNSEDLRNKILLTNISTSVQIKSSTNVWGKLMVDISKSTIKGTTSSEQKLVLIAGDGLDIDADKYLFIHLHPDHESFLNFVDGGNGNKSLTLTGVQDAIDTAKTNAISTSEAYTDSEISNLDSTLTAKINTNKGLVDDLENHFKATGSYPVIKYNPSSKKIVLTMPIYKGETYTSEFDASDFLVDGMIDKVELTTDHKFIFTFNTEAGKTPITVDATSMIPIYVQGDGILINGLTISIDRNSVVTTTQNGLMSYSDKVKIDGIESGANKYILPVSTGTSLGGIKIGYGDNVANGNARYGLLLSSDQAYISIPIADADIDQPGLISWNDKKKLNGIESGAQVNTVNTVAGKTGNVTLVKSDVGLGNVDNTSDTNKPISAATQVALDAINTKIANYAFNGIIGRAQVDTAKSNGYYLVSDDGSDTDNTRVYDLLLVYKVSDIDIRQTWYRINHTGGTFLIQSRYTDVSTGSWNDWKTDKLDGSNIVDDSITNAKLAGASVTPAANNIPIADENGMLGVMGINLKPIIYKLETSKGHTNGWYRIFKISRDSDYRGFNLILSINGYTSSILSENYLFSISEYNCSTNPRAKHVDITQLSGGYPKYYFNTSSNLERQTIKQIRVVYPNDADIIHDAYIDIYCDFTANFGTYLYLSISGISVSNIGSFSTFQSPTFVENLDSFHNSTTFDITNGFKTLYPYNSDGTYSLIPKKLTNEDLNNIKGSFDTNGNDVRSIKDFGLKIYYADYSNTSNNKPTEFFNQGFRLIVYTNSDSLATQIIMGTNDNVNNMYKRHLVGNNWSPWYQFITHVKLTNEDLNKVHNFGFNTYYAEAGRNTCSNKPESIGSNSFTLQVYGIPIGSSTVVDAVQIITDGSNGDIFKRTYKGSNNWNSWVKLATTNDNVASATSAKQLTTNILTIEDLNDIKDISLHIYIAQEDNSCSNKPTGTTGFSMTVNAVGADSRQQTLTDQNGKVYKRIFIGGSWTDWKKLLTEDDAGNNKSLSAELNTKGWYRVYESDIEPIQGHSIILYVSKSEYYNTSKPYQSRYSESYIFAISIGRVSMYTYSGDPKVSITQVSGSRSSTSAIDKIRVLCKKDGKIYIDINYSLSSDPGTVYINGIGEGTFQAPTLSDSIPLGYTATEFFTAESGLKADNLYISDGSITNSKIADGTISNAKIADFAITNGKIENETITKEKIADIGLGPNKIPITDDVGMLNIKSISTYGTTVYINCGSTNRWFRVAEIIADYPTSVELCISRNFAFNTSELYKFRIDKLAQSSPGLTKVTSLYKTNNQMPRQVTYVRTLHKKYEPTYIEIYARSSAGQLSLNISGIGKGLLVYDDDVYPVEETVGIPEGYTATELEL